MPYVCEYGGQKRALDPVELELKAVMSCLTQVLWTELKSSEEQCAPLTAEPTLQPLDILFYEVTIKIFIGFLLLIFSFCQYSSHIWNMSLVGDIY